MLLLGAWHGINPGMGWLFAVALGMQEGRGRAVWRALPPLALGHALSVVGVVLVGSVVGVVVDPPVLRWTVALALIGFGTYRLFRARHPRYGGMVVGLRELTIWSALMATAHGAGLMVLPFVLVSVPPAAGAHAGHAVVLAGAAAPAASAMQATLFHTMSYLLVSGTAAFAVMRWFGLRFLRTHWVNLDAVWAGALIVTGVVAGLMA
jgi:hypothetical protein